MACLTRYWLTILIWRRATLGNRWGKRATLIFSKKAILWRTNWVWYRYRGLSAGRASNLPYQIKTECGPSKYPYYHDYTRLSREAKAAGQLYITPSREKAFEKYLRLIADLGILCKSSAYLPLPFVLPASVRRICDGDHWKLQLLDNLVWIL